MDKDVKSVSNEEIGIRIRRLARAGPLEAPEGVQLLNAGFVQLEKNRAGGGAKARSTVKRKLT